MVPALGIPHHGTTQCTHPLDTRPLGVHKADVHCGGLPRLRGGSFAQSSLSLPEGYSQRPLEAGLKETNNPATESHVS